MIKLKMITLSQLITACLVTDRFQKIRNRTGVHEAAIPAPCRTGIRNRAWKREPPTPRERISTGRAHAAR